MVDACGTASNSCWLHKSSFTATAASASAHSSLALISRFEDNFIRIIPPRGAARRMALRTVPAAARPDGGVFYYYTIQAAPCATLHGRSFAQPPGGRIWKE